MLDKLKSLKPEPLILWVVAFIGVSVLVGLGKLDPKTIEYLLFAILGQTALKNKEKTNE